MKEIKCPHCHTVFKIDDSNYAAIADQVKNAEFQQEIERRAHELQERLEALQQVREAKSAQDAREALDKKELEVSKKDAEILRLNEKLKSVAQAEQLSYSRKLADKDLEIARLQAQLSQHERQVEIAVLNEQSKAKDVLQTKDAEIALLKTTAANEKSAALQREQSMKEKFESDLRRSQELIDYYKDMKIRLSTKMVGESLEVHCSTEFNRMRPLFPNAYFEKDNDASGGSKGDFIFRDYDEGFEFVSIMFEMKNENETTASKHKNEDFLKKLDEDRRAKHCEYAVLVSLLEPESELYNGGIVDMSHRYPKMYVIRPQFFIPLITLLVQTSKKSVDLQRQLIIAQNQSIDVTNFESKLLNFRESFGNHYERAARKFEDAIKQIDDSIDKLKKVKESLLGSEKYLRIANKDVDGLTIKKLTRGNATMKAKFDEARKVAEDVTETD